MGNRLRTKSDDIDAALQRARREPDPPAISDATYHPKTEMIILNLTSGRRVPIPREDIQILATAPRNKVAEIEIENFGTALHWPQLDLDLSLEGLLKGVTGNKRWMQALAWQKAEARKRPATSSSPSRRVSVSG